jgi:hypothetical protein
VLRTRLFTAVLAVFIGVIVLVGSSRAQSADPRSTVSEVSLPGGLRAALAAIGDTIAPDRAQFLVEFIRRTYDTPFGPRNDPREIVLRSLLAELKGHEGATDSPETLPLPLSASIWINVVFRGRATPQTLVSEILQSRDAALLYCGLLSLDDGTRAWLAGQPDLIAVIAARHPAAVLVAAPALRVTSAGVRVPGGALADPAWQALVGRRADEPADFVRALVALDEGHLANFFGMIGQLTPAQIQLALNLESSDVAARVESARRLYALFQRGGPNRPVEQRAFSRAAFDPGLLAADLSVDNNGQPRVPGSRGFWSAAFSESDDGRRKSTREDVGTLAGDEAADFSWLCEQVFKGDQIAQRRRYMMVLFASRRLGQITPGTARDGVDAVRAAGAYPALIATLERAGVVDLAAYASAARRATELSKIEDEARAFRAQAQFQGALALLTRAASRGSLTANFVTELVSSLAAIPVSEHGDYEGRVARWLGSWIRDARAAQSPQSAATATSAGSAEDVFEGAAGPMEQDVLRLLAGPAPREPRVVEWEGTRYRLDLARAEAMRLTKALGDSPGPYLSSAEAVVVIADALGEAGLTRDGFRQQGDALAHVAQADAEKGANGSMGDVLDHHRDVTAAVLRAARAGDVGGAPRLVPALRLLADELLARGLMELAYAAALGQREGVSISAADAAQRHDFGLRSNLGRTAPWRPPLPGTDTAQRWRVSGSLLGLDVGLADFSLVALSSRPLLKRPSLNEFDRRGFTDAVAIVETASLIDADRDTIVAAIQQGRGRLAAVATPEEALAIADAVGLSASRRTLLSWVVAHQPERLAVFLSPSELLWLGLGNTRVDALRAWGAAGSSRIGCLCLQIVDRRPWEIFAGRLHSGMMASVFPDLNFRLAEHLTDLHMPAALLGPVLASATLDLVNTVTSRDADDRRGLVEFVQALRRERVEQYLALLTTDGPLVPIGEAPTAKDSR